MGAGDLQGLLYVLHTEQTRSSPLLVLQSAGRSSSVWVLLLQVAKANK